MRTKAVPFGLDFDPRGDRRQRRGCDEQAATRVCSGGSAPPSFKTSSRCEASSPDLLAARSAALPPGSMAHWWPMKTADKAAGGMGGMMGAGGMMGRGDELQQRKLLAKTQFAGAEPAESAKPNTEAYDNIVDNPFHRTAQRAALDLLDRRRHRQLCQRPPLPQPEHAAAQGCGAHRRDAQLLRLSRRASLEIERASVCRSCRGRRLPVERPAPAGADRHRRQTHRPVPAAAQQPRLPGRRLRLDATAQQAPAGPVEPAAPGRTARRERSGRDGRLRRGLGIGAAVDLVSAQGRNPVGHRPVAGRRLDQRRRGHPARLRRRHPALHQERHQPRHPGHRRRLQRRRHQSRTS